MGVKIGGVSQMVASALEKNHSVGEQGQELPPASVGKRNLRNKQTYDDFLNLSLDQRRCEQEN